MAFDVYEYHKTSYYNVGMADGSGFPLTLSKREKKTRKKTHMFCIAACSFQ